jgi:hypothetical protein
MRLTVPGVGAEIIYYSAESAAQLPFQLRNPGGKIAEEIGDCVECHRTRIRSFAV